MSALTTVAAYKVLKGDKNVETQTQTAPSTLSQSIFAKPLTWLVIIGVAAYFGNKLIKKITAAKPIEDVKDDVTQLRKKQVPSYTDGQYNQYAQVLFSAMDGVGTDEEAIFRVMRYMKKDIDVAKLIVAFGVKGDNTLGAWLQDDLSSTDMEQVNKILANKGIKYQF